MRAFAYLIGVRIHHLQKRLRSLVSPWRRYHKLTIEKSVFGKIKTDGMFIAAVQLSRIINSLNAVGRMYMRVPDDGALTNSKDKFEVMLIYGSLLYEGLQEFSRLCKTLHALPSWSLHQAEVDYLNHEIGHGGTMFRKVVQQVRNHVTFHFEREAVVEALEHLQVANDVDFAIGETPRHFDVIYGLVDSLILIYLNQKGPTSRSVNELYRSYIHYVGSLATRLIDLSSDLLVEILGNVSTRRRGPLLNKN
jgi:hypothetical protein